MSKSLKDIKAPLERLIQCQIPVFIWGPTGLGKSSLVHQIANEQGRKVRDIRLSQIEFSDLRGLPVPNNGNVVWSKPDFLPTDENDTSIIFLDEMNCAHQMVLSAAYQLVLDRKIGEYTLPKGTVVIAAGNREEDNENVTEIPKPLLNRFAHLEVDYDFKAWEEHAKQSFHVLVTDYLSSKKSDLYCKPKDIRGYAFNTPRTWEKVSQILKSYKTQEDILSDIKTIKEATYACIGSAAIGFVDFIKTRSKEKVDFKKVVKYGKDYKLERNIDGNTLQYIKDAMWEHLLFTFGGTSMSDLTTLQLTELKKICLAIDNSIAFVQENSDKEFAKSMVNFFLQEKNIKPYPAYMPTYGTLIGL